MSVPRLTLALLMLAVAVYLAVTQPALQDLGALGDEYRKARDAQAARQSHLAVAERHERERQRALALFAAAPARSIPRIRRYLIERLAGLPLSDIHLEIGVAPAPAFAEAKVEAQGAFLELAALSSRLAQADAGLAFRQVSFARNERDERVKLTLTANTLSGKP